jgi:hypothetical protein
MQSFNGLHIDDAPEDDKVNAETCWARKQNILITF